MGKKKEYDKAYNDYWYQLYVYANNILRSHEAAEDVTQEVFLDLWNRLDSLTIDHYRAYLFKAVKFQCVKKLRKMPFTEVHLEKVEAVLSLDDSEYNLALEENKILLVKKIDATANDLLPERCLQIFKLRFKENLSYKEIASMLNISTSTVDNQINKALKTLRESGLYNSEMVLLQIILIGVAM
ncbi:sigma-70 family RNA polymerase sigma factor [Algibacter pacificus]|uniref:sigma-70 family RNA polymerase sigma factor n=1 Tax=Algibacter pacificus TaxID=2599389 RepID=UPI0011C7633D|nr:sigma-70 family RNA polymerase sigma factor [Algibacter pacificus]